MERRAIYRTAYDQQQSDLIALEREIWNDLRSQGASREELMAAMINLEAEHAALLAYARQWDATVQAQQLAVTLGRNCL